MDDSAAQFVAYSRKKLIEEYWPRTLTAIEGLTDEQIWWRPNEQSNSIGNLLLHLNGNVRQWILGAFGGAENTRNRDAEFRQREIVDPAALKAILAETLSQVDRILSAVSVEDLHRNFVIQGYQESGLTVLYHVVEHFSMHYGQIVYISKMIEGKDLGFYAHLTGSETPKI